MNNNWKEIFNVQEKGKKLPQSFIEEGKTILGILLTNYPKRLDGKESIIEMKNKNSKNWRQMEWMGWYFEEKSREILFEKLGGTIGPKFGNTEFDYSLDYVWDFKVHTLNENCSNWMILNDSEAIECAIETHNIIGYCICEGNVEYDDENQSFKKWHDNLKDKISNYEKTRIQRGAPSRKRKVAVNINNFLLFGLPSLDDIERGIKENWIKGFQLNFRNADGSPRRNKFQIDVKNIPIEYIIP